jgi:hypothetical protein
VPSFRNIILHLNNTKHWLNLKSKSCTEAGNGILQRGNGNGRRKMAPSEMLKKGGDLRQFQYLEMSNCFPCRQDATCGIAYAGKISGSI